MAATVQGPVDWLREDERGRQGVSLLASTLLVFCMSTLVTLKRFKQFMARQFPELTVANLTVSHNRSRDSAVGIEAGYGLDGREVRVQVPAGARFFSSPRRPDRFWDPLSFLCNGYRGLFAQG
jgi:hypothetical protein